MRQQFITIILLLAFAASTAQETEAGRQWFMFRGNYASGYLDNANLCRSWDASTGENIAWKTEIPGLGHSSPIIWGENIYVTTAVSRNGNDELKAGIYGAIESVSDSSVHEWILYCIDKSSGSVKWKQTCHKGIPGQKRHPMSSHANCTPATNGKYVVAFFGSEGLHCFTETREPVWKKNFGNLKSAFFLAETAEWEFASSPLIHEDIVVIQCDVLENSFLAAFDIHTGEEKWRKQRDELPGWCTPNIYFDDGETRIAVNGYKHRGGYDFTTGEEIWRMEGGGDIPVPTPVAGNNTIYFNSAHGKFSPILAIQSNARGEVEMAEEGESIKWGKLRGGSYMGTMLLYDGYLYNAAWNGRLTCYNAVTGEEVYSEKAGNGNSYTSSPIASDGVIFIADNDGKVYVVQAGPEYKLLKENALNEPIMSTPAVSDNFLIIRTRNTLYGISERGF
ncbi:MAG: PQQ-binding-like beta-propeller repeat protein [Mariniphaga sp.]